MPSLEAVEEALGNALRERFDNGYWDTLVYRSPTGRHENDVDWKLIIGQSEAAIEEKLFNDNPVPQLRELMTALFQAASEMKEEEMRGYAGVWKIWQQSNRS